MIRCREIATADCEAVIDLLNNGFDQQRDRPFWEQAMRCLAAHPTPPGYPRFGHMLTHEGTLVGAILQIFTRMPGQNGVRCSLSSWYVVPEYRPFAALLISRALRPAATYVNASPRPHTWPILEAQGYTRFCSGRLLTPLWLSRGAEAARVLPVRASDALVPDQHLRADDITLLRDHAGYGCISLLCAAGWRRYPFVFAVRRKTMGMARLIYCSPDAPVERFAGAIGRYLARRGIVLVALDAEGPIPGLVGRYVERPKYCKGPDRPRAAGDNAYSEQAMFWVTPPRSE